MAKQTINLGTTPNDGTGDNLRVGGDKINDNFTELYNSLNLAETLWSKTTITPTTVTNGSFINLLTLISNTDIDGVNSDTYDLLSIASNAIKTTWRGSKIIHLIRIAFNISTGTDQFYQIQIRRKVDDSVVYRRMVQRNSDETIQTVEMTTRTLSGTDPFVVDGFYLAFVNNSGSSADLTGTLSVLVISNYQTQQIV